ncbi:LysR family transcriptional regulator [Bacillus safensis]|uniref:LysR family transcriptional regulator n=1 Tax=Bacillus safensis TaxID=561879 RepID=UPI0005577378|nr:LysR family transcriptional regulator [Bacillus safensis]
MDIRVLRYFLTIAREGNFSSAAHFLHVTQPTLSRQIKELEEELGRKLFIRSNHGIVLTEDGLFLKKRAESIVEMMNKLKQDFVVNTDSISGDVFIGGGESEAIKYIGSVMKKLQNDYPNIRFHIYSGNEEDVTERLDRGLLDFAILIQPADLSKYQYIDIPDVDTWGVVTRRDSSIAKKISIRASDLLNIPLICSRQAMTTHSKNEFTNWLGEHNEHLNIVCTYNLAYNAGVMVNEGIGHAIVIDKIINTSVDTNLIFRAFEPQLKSGLSVVWSKHQAFSIAADLFLTKLKEHFK